MLYLVLFVIKVCLFLCVVYLNLVWKWCWKNNERYYDFLIGNIYLFFKIINNFKLNINFEDELKFVCFEKFEVFYWEFYILIFFEL